jgi:signal transduction histidine kinase
MKKHRRSISLKITLIVATAALVFLVVCIGLSYFCLFGSLRNSFVDGHRKMAQLMASSIANLIDRQAELITINASADSLKEALKQSNAKYQGMDTQAVRRYLLDMDNKWLKSSADHPFIEEYLGNKASLVLKSHTKQEAGFFNILLVDKYGGLVGSSYQPHGFYYAGEDWWKETLAEPAGRPSIGNAIFDEPSGIWSFPLATTIKDDKGEVIGAYKALVDISVFSKPLAGFKVGKGGKAALIDGGGYLIFYPEAKPYSHKFCEYNELQKLLKDERGWSVVDTVYMEKGKTTVAFSPVSYPLLLNKGVSLYVVVTENSGELFSPLNNLAAKMVIFSAILALAVLILAGMVFKGVFAGPIRELVNGMRYLGEGRLEYRVDIKTGDEMEELAAAFNEMAESLNHITTSIKVLEQEKAQHKIVQQRLEKASLGFLSLLSQVHGFLFDINKGIETVKQEAIKAQSEKEKRELELLQSQTETLIKNLEKDIYASNLETDKLEFKMELKDLRDIIKESVFVFEPKVREKGLDLRLDIPKSALIVYANRDKIREVFDTLIENSLKATEKGFITISVTEAKDEIECSITDTGTTIPEESLSDVFERFGGFGRVKLPEGAWPDPGFYIAKRIIEKHNGKIRAESIPGDITRFIFTLPVTPTK